MTVSSTPSATVVRPPRPGAIRRAGLAAVVVLGPLSITILSANPTYRTTDDPATVAAKIVLHRAYHARSATMEAGAIRRHM